MLNNYIVKMFSILLFLFHFSLSRIINTEILEDKHCNVSNFLMYPNNQTAIYFSQPDLSMFYQVTNKMELYLSSLWQSIYSHKRNNISFSNSFWRRIRIYCIFWKWNSFNIFCIKKIPQKYFSLCWWFINSETI